MKSAPFAFGAALFASSFVAQAETIQVTISSLLPFRPSYSGAS